MTTTIVIGLIALIYISGVVATVRFNNSRRKNYLIFQYGQSGYRTSLIITALLTWVGYGLSVRWHNEYKKDFPHMR